MRKVSLIDNWRNAWKFASIQLNTLGLFVMAALEILRQSWEYLPPHLQQKIPHATELGLILFALAIVGRLFVLEKKPDVSDQD